MRWAEQVNYKAQFYAFYKTCARYNSMPAIYSWSQRRSDVGETRPDLSHIAIVLGCIAIVFVFVCVLAMIIWTRPKHRNVPVTEATAIEDQITNQPGDRQNSSGGTAQQDVRLAQEMRSAGQTQELGDPPRYLAAKAPFRENDLPPAYESMEVWPGRTSQISKTRKDWTSMWPFRSTLNG